MTWFELSADRKLIQCFCLELRRAARSGMGHWSRCFYVVMRTCHCDNVSTFCVVTWAEEKRNVTNLTKHNSYWSTNVEHSRLLKKHSHWLFRSNMVHASFNDVKPSFNNLKAGKRGSYRYVWIKHGDAHVLHPNIALRSFLKDDSRLLSFVLTEQRRTKWSSRIQRLYKLLNQTSSFEFLWQYSFTNLN